jgi:hypothetical protein
LSHASGDDRLHKPSKPKSPKRCSTSRCRANLLPTVSRADSRARSRLRCSSRMAKMDRCRVRNHVPDQIPQKP